MKSLKLFLSVLEELRADGVMYVDKLTITPQKFPAYKLYDLEIWAIKESVKSLVCNVTVTEKSTTEAQDRSIKESITKKAMYKILEHHGF